MVNISELKIGQKVHYKSNIDDNDTSFENGIVKEIPKWSKDSVRVVYKCSGNWKDYKNYTSELTNVKSLYLDWKHETVDI